MDETQINYIWKHRKRNGLGQRKVASLLGLTDHTQFSKWERGEKLPNLQNALRLSHILQTPVESLFGSLYGNLSKEIEEREKSIPKEVKRSNDELFSDANS